MIGPGKSDVDIIGYLNIISLVFLFSHRREQNTSCRLYPNLGFSFSSNTDYHQIFETPILQIR